MNAASPRACVFDLHAFFDDDPWETMLLELGVPVARRGRRIQSDEVQDLAEALAGMTTNRLRTAMAKASLSPAFEHTMHEATSLGLRRVVSSDLPEICHEALTHRLDLDAQAPLLLAHRFGRITGEPGMQPWAGPCGAAVCPATVAAAASKEFGPAVVVGDPDAGCGCDATTVAAGDLSRAATMRAIA